MKSFKRKIFSIILLPVAFGFLFINDFSDAYYFGLKSANNTSSNIQQIEQKYKVNLPIVSFIFDPRDESDVINSIDKIVSDLGKDRIYHFTISPDEYSAEDIVMGKFDTQYRAFFQKIKDLDLYVIFRTMHEMNGGWYPRSSNPEKFKAAWIHVRSLARSMGLSNNNIAFDFSVNHRDMPTKGTPSQIASLIECNQKKSDCRHFEDYYPGDEFIDVIGFSFYNRGKANSNRLWLSPEEILYDKNRNTYERLKKFGKPIIIDEVATTSVRYEGSYNYNKSKSEYLENSERKDYRLEQLQQFLVYHPEIIAAIYFNTDYTHGLDYIVTGEADRAIINLENNKFYNGFRGLDLFGEKDLNNILSKLFNTSKITIDGIETYVPKDYAREIQIISTVINKKSNSINDKLELLHKLSSIDFGSEAISWSLKTLDILYDQELEKNSKL